MIHFKNWHLIIIILILTFTYLFVSQPAEQKNIYFPFLTSRPKQSASPSPEVTPSAEVPQLELPTCVHEGEISQTLSRSFFLQTEQFFPEADVLECTYQSEELINEILPSFSYLLRRKDPGAEKRWQTQRMTNETTPAFRRFEEAPWLFALLNPVKELSQITLYGWQADSYIEMTYTPVREDDGVQLQKGKQVMEQVFKTLK